MSSDNIYYVYTYTDPSTNIPFYVGYGKKLRAWDHLAEARKEVTAERNLAKLHKIRKILREEKEPLISIVESSLSKEAAKTLEKKLILHYGRKDLKTGPLTNMTAGGDGYVGKSCEVKQRISNRMKDTIIAKDAAGVAHHVKRDDERWISGELVGINKNSKSAAENMRSMFAGKINVKDAHGNNFKLPADDQRILSGELVGVAKNTIIVKDANGNRFRVDKTDPRYLSGELVYFKTGTRLSDKIKLKCLAKSNSPEM